MATTSEASLKSSYDSIKTINVSKVKRNELYQSNRGMIRHINARKRKLPSMGKENGRPSNLIQPTSKTQTKIRVRSCNQQLETRSM